MAILTSLHHVTRYRYDRPVGLGPHVVRLRPAPHCRTRVPSYSLKVSPARHFVNWLQDPLGNWLARIVLPEWTTAFEVEVGLTAEMAPINPFDFFIEPYAEEFPFAYPDDLAAELSPYLKRYSSGETLDAFLADLPKGPRPTIELLEDQKGKRFIRIAYATGGAVRRGPVTLRTRDLERLGRLLAKSPELAGVLGRTHDVRGQRGEEPH